jgi:hypothetical protein
MWRPAWPTSRARSAQCLPRLPGQIQVEQVVLGPQEILERMAPGLVLFELSDQLALAQPAYPRHVSAQGWRDAGCPGRGWGGQDSRAYMKLQLERAGVRIAVDPKQLQDAVNAARS